eukprot:g7706.t1
MAPHGFPCAFFVAIRYRPDNRLMLIHQQADIACLIGFRLIAPEGGTRDEAAPDHRQEFPETRIVGGIRDSQMQGEVSLAGGLLCLKTGAHSIMTLQDHLFLRGRTAQGRKAGRFYLHSGSQFQQFDHRRDACEIDMAKRKGECANSVTRYLTLLIPLILLFSFPARAEWVPSEQIKTYTVSGATGIALYSAIGEKGPLVAGGTRTIAHTDFKLLWSRKYEPQPDGSCMLVSARPSLTLIYTLPGSGTSLPPQLKQKWQVFVDGVRRHERVHGDMIVEMVKEIEALSVGFSVADDRKCEKIRKELTVRLGEISRRNRERHRAYDKVEMNDGGNVHQLILNLKSILVLAHLDTVHAHGVKDAQLTLRREGDRFYGPGIYDMKSGALMALEALRLAVSRGARMPIDLVFVPDEEVGSLSSREVIEELARGAAYALVVEPARDGGKIVISRKGVAMYDVTVRGRAAHAGVRPQDGRNAIRAAAKVVLQLDALNDPASGVTVTVGTIQGGTGRNTVPAECRLQVDVRVPDNETASSVTAAIEAITVPDPDITVEIIGQMNRPPFAQSAAGAELFERAAGIARQLDIELEGMGTGGGSDGNFTAALGVPTLDGLGADGAGAHTFDEHILVSIFHSRRLRQTTQNGGSMTSGIHHITAITRKVQANVDFYVGFLGLRLVKRTAGFEDAQQLHLFYGDGAASPGTLVTFLVWEDGSLGRVGHGAPSELSFAIEKQAIGFWLTRALHHNVKLEGPMQEFGEPVLRLADPDGIIVKLVGMDNPPAAVWWEEGGIGEAEALRGIRGATILSEKVEQTAEFLTRFMGFQQGSKEGTIERLQSDAGQVLDIRDASGFWTAAPGTGAIDHVAVRSTSREKVDEVHRALQSDAPSDMNLHDRHYFYSLYVREPGGTLIELASDGPGFAVDEPVETLGSQLFIPSHFRTDGNDLKVMLPQFGLPGEERVTYRDLPFVHRIHMPEEPDGSTIVLLHGSGGTEVDLFPLARRISPAALLVGVRGRSTEEGIARFFRRIGADRFDQQDIVSEAEAFAAFVDDLSPAYGVDPQRTAFIGYSNGANMLAAVMRLQPGAVRHAALLRPRDVLEQVATPDLSGASALIVTGAQDPFRDYAEALSQRLSAGGIAVTWREADTGHDLAPDDDRPAGVAAALRGGADRLELCSALALGGLTPSPGMMRYAARMAGVPVYAMIRPRAGDFQFCEQDFDAMMADIDHARNCGLSGVVLGANRPDGSLDVARLETLVSQAAGLGLTLHRAFDMVPDPAEALEQAIGLGFERILTSGQACSAPEGLEAIRLLQDKAGGRISIMAGSGVKPTNVVEIVRRTGIVEVHGSCRGQATRAHDSAIRFGFAQELEFETSEQIVKEMRLRLSAFGQTARRGDL